MSEGSLVRVDHDGDTFAVLIYIEDGFLYSAILSEILLDKDTVECISQKAVDLFYKGAEGRLQ